MLVLTAVSVVAIAVFIFFCTVLSVLIEGNVVSQISRFFVFLVLHGMQSNNRLLNVASCVFIIFYSGILCNIQRHTFGLYNTNYKESHDFLFTIATN